jgi:uncharacterized protein
MVISPTQLMIIVRDVNVQALKFLLGSELDKFMGSSINSANVLLTIEPKTTMEVMILATGDTQRRIPERLEWAVQEVDSKTKTSGTESSQ